MDEYDNNNGHTQPFSRSLIRKLITLHVEEAEVEAEAVRAQERGEEERRNQSTRKDPTRTILPTLTHEAADAVGELLKIFVLEARRRASTQAEIEQAVKAVETHMRGDEEQDGDVEEDPPICDDKYNKRAQRAAVRVRADHITKISAEMLMDFS